MALDAVTAGVIERSRSAWLRKGRTPRNANKQLAILRGIFKRAAKVYGLVGNPAADVEKVRERHDSTRFHFYAPEEVWALTRAAGSEQDAAMYLTAAFTGLRRGELIALRWRDVDFAGDAIGVRRQLRQRTLGRAQVGPRTGRADGRGRRRRGSSLVPISHPASPVTPSAKGRSDRRGEQAGSSGA